MKFFSALVLAFLATAACSANNTGTTPLPLADLGMPTDLTMLPDLNLPPSCSDHVKNGTETDIDCGGACASCGVGQTCGKYQDCRSWDCTSNMCGRGQLGALKVTRDGWSIFDGKSSKSKTWLTADNGAALTVGGVDSISEQSLAGFKSFILIFDHESDSQAIPTFTDDEITALKGFVLKGGSLAIFYGYQADYPANLHAAFQVNLTEAHRAKGTLSFNDQLPATIRNGPWGSVPASLSWSNNYHENVSLDADSKAVLIASNDVRGEAALIPPAALGSGSGPVFFFADWYWSYSDDTDGNAWNIVFQNTVAFMMSH